MMQNLGGGGGGDSSIIKQNKFIPYHFISKHKYYIIKLYIMFSRFVSATYSMKLEYSVMFEHLICFKGNFFFPGVMQNQPNVSTNMKTFYMKLNDCEAIN
jgi:hypothetical protein